MTAGDGIKACRRHPCPLSCASHGPRPLGSCVPCLLCHHLLVPLDSHVSCPVSCVLSLISSVIPVPVFNSSVSCMSHILLVLCLSYLMVLCPHGLVVPSPLSCVCVPASVSAAGFTADTHLPWDRAAITCCGPMAMNLFLAHPSQYWGSSLQSAKLRLVPAQ